MDAEASHAASARPVAGPRLTSRTVLSAAARLALAALLLAGVAQQYVWGLGAPPGPGGYTANYLSYFTIESNVLAAVTLVLFALEGLRGRRPDWLAVLGACSASYMFTTGVVYNALLRQLSGSAAFGASWPNETAHLIGPALVLLDWLLVSPGLRLRWRTLVTVASYPIAWLVYTMIRGALTGFYPYPFLEPAQPGGWAAVAGYIVGISAFIIAAGVGVILLSHRRAHGHRRLPDPSQQLSR